MKLEEAGVDIIDVPRGLCSNRPTQVQDRQSCFMPQAQQIKKVVNLPVIGVGGITEPKYANSLMRKGRVDLVAVGRALLKDPN